MFHATWSMNEIRAWLYRTTIHKYQQWIGIAPITLTICTHLMIYCNADTCVTSEVKWQLFRQLYIVGNPTILPHCICILECYNNAYNPNFLYIYSVAKETFTTTFIDRWIEWQVTLCDPIDMWFSVAVWFLVLTGRYSMSIIWMTR